MITKLPLLAASLAVTLLIQGCASAPPSVVKNGEVEFSKDGAPLGWAPFAPAGAEQYAKMEWDLDEHRNGTHAVSIEILRTQPQQLSVYMWQGHLEGFKTNTWYELESYVKAKNLRETAWVEIQCWNRDGKKILATYNSRKTSQILDKREWEQVKFRFRVPRGTASVVVRACVNGQTNQGGKVSFDDFKLWSDLR